MVARSAWWTPEVSGVARPSPGGQAAEQRAPQTPAPRPSALLLSAPAQPREARPSKSWRAGRAEADKKHHEGDVPARGAQGAAPQRGTRPRCWGGGAWVSAQPWHTWSVERTRVSRPGAEPPASAFARVRVGSEIWGPLGEDPIRRSTSPEKAGPCPTPLATRSG